MSELKELKRLKEEEKGLINIAIKMNDQLNRLKVEELALLSMLHAEAVPNEEKEKGNTEECCEEPEDQPSSSHSGEKKEELVPLDLNVNTRHKEEEMEEEEEEEEEGEEGDGEDFILNALLF